ncbi:MAG: GTPase ObgE [Candidatus Omnitrophica bacterium]|nr:GTPase ObgE [Candidatus Omnitrophota bacterium]
MFIDSAKIYVKGGNGGNGCRSIYRDKYTRQGIPDGGDGGKGANIILRANRNLRTLMDFKFNRHFYGHKGEHGSGNDMTGKSSPDMIVRVPCGVIVKDADKDCVLGSLDHDGQELIVARGGKGGIGNKHRMEPTPGVIGEERNLLLDLKLIADVGMVGFPNAGKSTLISAISNARPKIAPYPFTTLSPILGVVGERDESFIIADIPGLIEGASSGRGLGHDFLKHVERTKILIHLIDMSGFEGRDPLEDYKTINRELKSYSKDVYSKPQLIVANKMDLEESAKNLKNFKSKIKKKVYPISALQKTGLEDLIEGIRKKL